MLFDDCQITQAGGMNQHVCWVTLTSYPVMGNACLVRCSIELSFDRSGIVMLALDNICDFRLIESNEGILLSASQHGYIRQNTDTG